MTTFRDYYNGLSVAQRAEIAKRADTAPIYLYQIASGVRRPSPEMAKKLHHATGFAVSLHALRPDVWDAA
jgi:DNA-binding transcriptional regulator YdaS (Cro superfamily)